MPMSRVRIDENIAMLIAVVQLDGFECTAMHSANVIQEPNNFMTLVEALPNMVGAHGLRTMKPLNRWALK
jgi:hypothetical protein